MTASEFFFVFCVISVLEKIIIAETSVRVIFQRDSNERNVTRGCFEASLSLISVVTTSNLD